MLQVFAKKMHSPRRKWANLRKYALETSPGADCENMRSSKIILSPYAVRTARLGTHTRYTNRKARKHHDMYGFSSTSSHVFLDFAVLLLVPSILAYYSRIYCRYGCPGYAGDVLHFWNMISALPRVLAASEGHKYKAK